MESRPKVSIIIPIYKTEKYLDRCMKYVLKQTLTNIEIILVDDESPDGAPAMCDEYAKRDCRVKVIHKKNGGLGLARNSGMEIATGEYVAFLDSDDYVSEEMYEKLYNRAKETNSDTCFCGCFVDRDNNNLISIPFPLGDCCYRKREDIIKNVLLNLLGATPEAKTDNVLGMQVWRGLYSLKLIRDNNILFCSERNYICEDAIFHIDYFNHANTFSSITDCYYYYCMYGVSLSRVYRADRFDKNVIFFREEQRRLEQYNLLSAGIDYIDRMFLAMIRGNMKDAVEHLNFFEAVKKIKRIISNTEVRSVIRRYPYNRNPFKWKMFNTLIAYEAALLLSVLIKIIERK